MPNHIPVNSSPDAAGILRNKIRRARLMLDIIEDGSPVDENILIELNDLLNADNRSNETLLSIFEQKEHSERDFTAKRRRDLAKKGMALPDGSFPIVTVGDLRNAIQAFGRAKNKSAARRHIIKRARVLGRTDLLPDGWIK